MKEIAHALIAVVILALPMVALTLELPPKPKLPDDVVSSLPKGCSYATTVPVCKLHE